MLPTLQVDRLVSASGRGLRIIARGTLAFGRRIDEDSPGSQTLTTLVDENGLKVDGVSSTKQQARNPGWTLVF